MIATESADKARITFSSVYYDTKEYGKISYLNLTRFFFSVHEKHYLDHPDAKKFKGKVGLREFFVEDVKEVLDRESEGSFQEDEDKAKEKEITFENHKRMCTDAALGLCLIYFVDGKDKRGVKKALKLYKGLQKMPEMKGKAVMQTFVSYNLIWFDLKLNRGLKGGWPYGSPKIFAVEPEAPLFCRLESFSAEREAPFWGTEAPELNPEGLTALRTLIKNASFMSLTLLKCLSKMG